MGINKKFSPFNRKNKFKNQRQNNIYSAKNIYKRNTFYEPTSTENTAIKISKKIFVNLFKILITIFLIAVITGCIVVTALTVYVMKYIDTDTDIDIRNLKNSTNSVIYAANISTGEEKEVEKIYSTSNKLWVDITQIPQHVMDAFVYTEDERFFEHEGVDWKRTFSAFANLFLKFYDTKQGGSTITQQLIKNVTGKDEVSIDRKIQEIFKAMNLERHYSKSEILEGYLNIVHMANNTDGIGAASIYYFNKNVSDLNVVEGAALAAMTKNPVRYDPISNPENNKSRRKYVLSKMLEFKAISEDEYNKYINQELTINKGGTVQNNKDNIQSYFVDHLINEVISDLIDTKKFTSESAQAKLNNGGLKIYSTINEDIQNLIESKYDNYSTFSNSNISNPPQSAMVVMNYQGQILGLVGGRGKKTQNRIFNRATQSKRSPGSSMKPIGVYAPAIEKNIITFSTIHKDSPIQIIEDGVKKNWPQNYGGRRYSNMTTSEAIERSINTIPVRILQKMGIDISYDFLQNQLGITTLVDSQVINGTNFSDRNLSGLALGGLTHGLYLHELTASYQIFGNKGLYYKPTTYTKVVDSNGTVLLDHQQPKGEQVISEETSGVMNIMLKQVIDGPNGTGKLAKITNYTVMGKTGTTNDDKDQLFIAGTPSYLAGVWIGHDNPAPITNTFAPTRVWKNVLGDFITKNEVRKEFNISEKVKKLQYCTHTGLIAKSSCYSKKDGYYKESYIPDECNIH